MKQFGVTSTDHGGGKRHSGYVPELQEGPDFRIDALLLLFVDYASPAQAVGFYRHQSRRGCVLHWKDYRHVQFAVHCDLTQLENLGSLGARSHDREYCPAETLWAITPSGLTCASHVLPTGNFWEAPNS